MKTIISTLYLKERIKKAIDNRINYVIFQQNSISLIGENKKIVRIDTELQIEKNLVLPANVLQWYHIYQFLQLLPEQPIVMEIDHYGENDINIDFTQFIARF